MRFRSVVIVLTAVILISGLSYAGWTYVQERESHTCAACQRPVHAHTRTTAIMKGKHMAYCCPACALSQQQQTGTPVTVESLAEYGTGQRLRPEAAFLVRGSDVNSCSHHALAAVGLDKQPIEARFDRCSPGLIAFSGRRQANAFAQEHGGQVLRFQDVATGFGRR